MPDAWLDEMRTDEVSASNESKPHPQDIQNAWKWRPQAAERRLRYCDLPRVLLALMHVYKITTILVLTMRLLAMNTRTHGDAMRAPEPILKSLFMTNQVGCL